MLEDSRLQVELLYLSLGILIIGALVGVFVGIFLPHEQVSWRWFIELVVLSLVALPIHELVHAAAFLVLTGFRAHVSFGFSHGMLFTRAPGTMLRRVWFCCVLMAPAVILTTLLWVGCALFGKPLLGMFCAVVHLAGCTGDAALVHAICSEPRANLVEDTPRGVSLIHDE